MAMVLEKEIVPLGEWFRSGLWWASLAILVVVLAAAFIGFLVAVMRHGPRGAVGRVWQAFIAGVSEFAEISPRRLYAMARLAVQESIRRWVLAVFAVFLLLLAFAALFMNRGNIDHPARWYLSFVITATNYLVMLLAIMLSTFSLPADVKNRTIYTVVTKPVRAWELIIGRILGFTAIGTLILTLVGVSSYIFVWRGLNHRHVIQERELKAVDPGEAGRDVVRTGRTSFDAYHRHEVVEYKDGTLEVVENLDHTHRVLDDGAGEPGQRTFRLGEPEGMLQARIPVRGKLRFIDRDGKETDKGINVGYEWGYRSYVEGGTGLSTAIWTFAGVNERRFGDYLPLEINIRVFRTYKGIIDQGIAGKLEVVRPDGTLRSQPINFIAKDGMVDQHFIPRKLKSLDAQGNETEIDLYNDLVQNGQVEIWLRCLENNQYFGVAPADAYLRDPVDGSFNWNFIKGYLGLWFQMFVITCYGVMFSSFLNGPVAMLATISVMVIGFFPSFVQGVALGTLQGDVKGAITGGGPLESLYRTFRQMNQTVPLEGPAAQVVHAIDGAVMFVLDRLTQLHIVPDFNGFSMTNFVVYGFDVPHVLVIQNLIICLAYFALTSAIAYYCFRSREIAA